MQKRLSEGGKRMRLCVHLSRIPRMGDQTNKKSRSVTLNVLQQDLSQVGMKKEGEVRKGQRTTKFKWSWQFTALLFFLAVKDSHRREMGQLISSAKQCLKVHRTEGILFWTSHGSF